jgi:hypothetical protein
MSEPETFHVRLSDEPGPGHVILGAADAEQAAMQFLEHWAPEDCAVEEVRVIVTGEAGHSQCLAIHIDIHRIEPC